MSSADNNFYRADIDGLRAIAILSVVIFHMAPEYFPGGFAGVDIFFVISGYLISSIIMKQMEKGSFSFKDFYVKRIIRLFPSLLLVLTCTIVLGWLLLLPGEFEQLGKHTASGASFLANITFLKEVSYFNKASELKQLLHLWSLGIEEQFYLFWPPVLYITWKISPSMVPLIAIFCISYSFGININKVATKPEFAFFMPQARFWELIFGGLLAYLEFKKIQIKSPSKLNALGILGFILCIAGFLILDNLSQFPGCWAFLPVIGTSMLIASGKNSFINSKILSNKALVFIGLISYPLYLWHWPLLSFSQVLYSQPAPFMTRIALVSLAFFLAILTYLYLEKPLKIFQGRARSISATVILGGMCMIGAFGYLIYTKNILPLSERSNLSQISDALNDWDFPGRLKRSLDKKGNRISMQGENPQKVIFIGDSNIQQYYPRAEMLMKEKPNALGLIFVSAGGCPPLPFVKSDSKYNFCESWINNGYAIANQQNVKNVVIAAQWTAYFSKGSTRSYVMKDNKKHYISDMGIGYSKALKQLKEMITSLKKNKKNVFLVLNIPVGIPFDPVSSLERSFSLNSIVRKNISVNRDTFEKPHVQYFSDLKKVALAAGAIVIDPLDFLCPEPSKVCMTALEDGRPIYKDSSHLRPFFVRDHMTFLDKVMY